MASLVLHDNVHGKNIIAKFNTFPILSLYLAKNTKQSKTNKKTKAHLSSPFTFFLFRELLFYFHIFSPILFFS